MTDTEMLQTILDEISKLRSSISTDFTAVHVKIDGRFEAVQRDLQDHQVGCRANFARYDAHLIVEQAEDAAGKSKSERVEAVIRALLVAGTLILVGGLGTLIILNAQNFVKAP